MSDATTNVPTEKTQESSKPLYLVLSNAMFWRDPTTGFQLSWNSQTTEKHLRDRDPKSLKAIKEEAEQEPKTFDPNEGNWWIALEDVPKNPELRKMLNRAVNAGKMELTSDYAQWLIDKQNAKIASKSTRKGLIWTETSIKKVQERKQMPRNPSIARGTMTYSDPDSKAYKILQETSHELKQLLPKIVGALPKDSQTEFLQEALSIEKSGYNRAVTPRSAVIDLIMDLMRDLGIASGIGIVTTEQGPITSNVKSVERDK